MKIAVLGYAGSGKTYLSDYISEKIMLENGAVYINCGSVALPKEGTPHSYLVYENGELTFHDLETGGMFDCVTL